MAGKFVVSQASDGQYMFNLLAGNGQVILTSELYTSRAGAINGIESVKKNAANADMFERREAKDESPYFVLKAGNGQEIGRSELYSGISAMENGIQSVMKNAPEATVEDKTS